MNESFGRIRAIASAEVQFRFRRTAGIATWLVVAALVYLIIPDFHVGWALMRIKGMRVLYNSSAVALGTGVFCATFTGLLGYYLVSNSLRRDIISRTGAVIAATPVSNAQCIIGRFIGNTVYLAMVPLACMMSTMVMFLFRGEGPLEPLVFLEIYLWLMVPVVAFCSAAALAFESLPVLSGRFGDLLYFLVWTAMLGWPAAMANEIGKPSWASTMDVIGLGVVVQELQARFHTVEMTIGGASIDPTGPTLLFPGIDWTWRLVLERTSTLALPLVVLGLATLWFHRFDPARVKYSTWTRRRNPIARLNAMLKSIAGLNVISKPVTRLFGQISHPGKAKPTVANAIRADIAATFALSPLTGIAIVSSGILCLVEGAEVVQHAILPAIFAVLVAALADITVRDSSAGMTTLLFTAPKLKANYVLWKFFSVLAVAL